MDLGLVVREEADWTVLAVSGEIDIATAPSLREKLHSLLAEGHQNLFADLDEVTFLDSSGLRVLAQSQRRLTGAHGPPRLRLVVAGAAVERVFDVTGLRSFFDVYATQEDAVRGR